MEDRFSERELREDRTWGALGYIVFFLPLWQRPGSRLGRRCANQGLLATVLIVLISVLGAILSAIPFVGWLFRVACGVVSLALLVLQIFCFARLMTSGQVTELPYIGIMHLLPGLDDDGSEDEKRW